MTNLWPNPTIITTTQLEQNIVIPAGSVFQYDTSSTKLTPDQSTLFSKPIARVLSKDDVLLAAKWLKNQPTVDEQSALFTISNYLKILEVFTSWTSTHWSWGAKVPTGVGNKYKVTFPIFPNIVNKDADGYKTLPGDNKSGQFRISCGSEKTELVDLGVVKNLQYTNFIHEFTAVTSETEILFEYLGLHGLQNNGLYIGNPVLELVSSVTPTPVPTPTTTTSPTYSNIQLAQMALSNAEQYLDMVRVALGIESQKESTK